MNRGVVENDVRLAILSHLIDQELTVERTSLHTGLNPPRIEYHLRILFGENLVMRRRDGEQGPVVYSASLDDLPELARAAVEGRRARVDK